MEKQLSKVQLFNLFEIAKGCFGKTYKYLEEFGVNWIQIEDSGYRLHHFKIIPSDVDVRFGNVFDFEYFTTDLRSDDRRTEKIMNQKLLHEKLTEYGFY